MNVCLLLTALCVLATETRHACLLQDSSPPRADGVTGRLPIGCGLVAGRSADRARREGASLHLRPGVAKVPAADAWSAGGAEPGVGAERQADGLLPCDPEG